MFVAPTVLQGPPVMRSSSSMFILRSLVHLLIKVNLVVRLLKDFTIVVLVNRAMLIRLHCFYVTGTGACLLRQYFSMSIIRHSYSGYVPPSNKISIRMMAFYRVVSLQLTNSTKLNKLLKFYNYLLVC